MGEEIIPFHPGRNGTVDTFRWARKRLAVTAHLEVDVTEARAGIRVYRRSSGQGLGFTAWVVGCVARAAAEHPRVHALRLGRRRIIQFDEVDVAVLVERRVEGAGRAETLPVPFVIRCADRKPLTRIHEEIQGAAGAGEAPGSALQSLFFRLPAWLRDLLFWRWLFRSPGRVKKTMGTVVVTSVGMMTPGVLAWATPVSVHPLAVGVGGIARRSTAEGVREILALTVVFDHAVIDGAPAGRFVHRLHGLMTQGFEAWAGGQLLADTSPSTR